MSNLWPQDFAGQAASVSICGTRGSPVFTPWSNGGESDECEMTFSPDAAAAAAPAELDAFTQGFEEGRRTVELELAAEREALAKLAAGLETLRPEPTRALAALLAETVERLVRQIVGEVEIDPTMLVKRAERAAQLIGEDTTPSKLLVHPDDVALLADAQLPVPVAGDETLTRGSVRLETGEGWIEDGPEVRLDRLRAELDRMGAGE